MTVTEAARVLTEAARELLCLTEADGRVVAAAGPWYDATGIGPDALPRSVLDMLVHADDRATLRQHRATAVAGAVPPPFDLRLVAGPPGRLFDVALRVHEQRVLVSLRDVTHQRRAEEHLALLNERLRDTNAELQRSNAELQRFAYVASHDLSEPLRMVTSYCDLLRVDYSDVLDDTAREYLGYAVDGALRMRTLIDDLLAYSRVSSSAPDTERVELDAVFADALHDVGGAVADTGAQVAVGPLPAVRGNPAQLHQLATNLLSNAVKFRTPGTDPVVSVAAQVRGAQVKLSVADNGIGVPEQHRERIFVMFKRLHGRAAYGGNGIGLALCKRIAELHGGSVWVQSAPGGGSVFHVTLPVADAEVPA
jgi:signal transduction histidine kinase